MLHEIVEALNRPQRPVVGEPVRQEDMALLDRDPRGFMAWLREHTLSLR